MKLKKAKKILKELGFSTVDIKKYKDESCDNDTIRTDRPHKLDDAKVVDTCIRNGSFEIEYKKNKKKKKKDSQSARLDELSRLKRNIHHVKTGEGVYEEDPEELEKRENARQEQIEKNQRQNQRNQNRDSNNNQNEQQGDIHHQNRDALKQNRQNSNNDYRAEDSQESGNSPSSNKPSR